MRSALRDISLSVESLLLFSAINRAFLSIQHARLPSDFERRHVDHAFPIAPQMQHLVGIEPKREVMGGDGHALAQVETVGIEALHA